MGTYAPAPRPVQPSRLRPLKHGCLAALAVCLVGAVLGGLGVFPNAEKAGEATGAMAMWLFLSVVAASAAFQLGVRWAGIGCSVLATVIGLAVVGLWVFAIVLKPEKPVQLTAEEQGSLTLSSDRTRLCSVPLGFSLPVPDPDAFAPVPTIQARLNELLAAQNGFGWVYVEDNSGERVIVLLTKGLGRSEATFRGFAKGVGESFGK
jgi:hypothetical protein